MLLLIFITTWILWKRNSCVICVLSRQPFSARSRVVRCNQHHLLQFIPDIVFEDVFHNSSAFIHLQPFFNFQLHISFYTSTERIFVLRSSNILLLQHGKMKHNNFCSCCFWHVHGINLDKYRTCIRYIIKS